VQTIRKNRRFRTRPTAAGTVWAFPTGSESSIAGTNVKEKASGRTAGNDAREKVSGREHEMEAGDVGEGAEVAVAGD
jgi:hypothetical protein